MKNIYHLKFLHLLITGIFAGDFSGDFNGDFGGDFSYIFYSVKDKLYPTNAAKRWSIS